MAPEESLEVKGSATSIVFPQVLLSIPLFIWLLAAVKWPHLLGDSSSIIPPLSILMFIASLSVWARSIVIRIEDGLLTYQSLMQRAKSIRFEEIKELTLAFGAARGRSTWRIEVHPKDLKANEPFDMNVKMLSRGDFKRLEAALRAKAKYIS